jgi:hypothetical protein
MISTTDIVRQFEKPYQENNGNVQHKCNHCVKKQCPETNRIELGHLNLGNFPEEGNSQVEERADRGEVVE